MGNILSKSDTNPVQSGVINENVGSHIAVYITASNLKPLSQRRHAYDIKSIYFRKSVCLVQKKKRRSKRICDFNYAGSFLKTYCQALLK